MLNVAVNAWKGRSKLNFETPIKGSSAKENTAQPKLKSSGNDLRLPFTSIKPNLTPKTYRNQIDEEIDLELVTPAKVTCKLPSRRLKKHESRLEPLQFRTPKTVDRKLNMHDEVVKKVRSYDRDVLLKLRELSSSTAPLRLKIPYLQGAPRTSAQHENEDKFRKLKRYTRKISEKNLSPQEVATIWAEVEREKIEKDLYLYNAAIGAFGKTGNWRKSVSLLYEMKRRGVVRNLYSFSSAMIACEKQKRWHQILDIWDEMKQGRLRPGSYSNRIILAAFSNTKKREGLCRHLEEMRRQGNVNKEHYTTALSGCRKFEGQGWKLASQLLSDMKKDGVQRDAAVYTSAISAAESEGRWKEALSLLDGMEREGISLNTITCNAAISACEKARKWEEAVKLLDRMRREGIQVNEISYTAAISACSRCKQWKEAHRLLKEMDKQNIKGDILLLTEVINCFAKCGEWQLAVYVLDSLETRNVKPNIVVYGAAIRACEVSGEGQAAMHLFHRVKCANLEHNSLTYTSTMHALIKEKKFKKALELFKEMKIEGVSRDIISYRAAMTAARGCKNWKLLSKLKKEMAEESPVRSQKKQAVCR